MRHFLLVVAGMLIGAGFAYAELAVWPVDALHQTLRSDLPLAKPADAVYIEASRNEVENGQIAFRADADIESLKASATPLVGSNGKALPASRVRFVGYVPVKKNTDPHLHETGEQVLIAKAPAHLPDPLLEDSAIPAKKDETGAIWLTVSVPGEADAGVYEGTVAIETGAQRKTVPVKVKVYAARVPEAMTLKVVNWYYPVVLTHTYRVKWWDEKFWQLVESDAASMRLHRQSVGHVIIHETIHAIERADGAVEFDFSHFDRMVETFRKAGLPYILGSAIAGRHEWLSKDFYAIPLKLTRADGTEGVFPAPEDPQSQDEQKRRVWATTHAFEKYVSVFLPALQAHLDEKGWTSAYMQHLADEPVDSNAAAYRHIGGLVKKYAPKLRRAEAVRTTDLVGGLDIWAPLLNELDRHKSFYEKREKAGDEIWFYTCERPRGQYMNRLIDYPLLKTRLLHWANYFTGTVGFLHWGFNPSWGNPFENAGDPPGDAHLVYPGVAHLRGAPQSEDKFHSLDSIRYEAMRDGIEDYELLRVIAGKSRKKADDICRMAVKSLTEYTLDPEQFAKARRALLEAASVP